MFVEASIVVGAILCAKAGAVTYAYVYHRESFDRQCANCERATSGFDFSDDGGGDKKGETGKETGDDERGTSEEPSAPKRMKDVKKGRSFMKMFSSEKKKTGGFRGLDDDDDAKKS
jgi:hypothetical protein